MLEKVINGYSVVAYATQPEHGVPARAFLETRRVQSDEEALVFEIFTSRRFRGTVEAMAAARNALDRVKTVDPDGVPEPLPE